MIAGQAQKCCNELRQAEGQVVTDIYGARIRRKMVTFRILHSTYLTIQHMASLMLICNITGRASSGTEKLCIKMSQCGPEIAHKIHRNYFLVTCWAIKVSWLAGDTFTVHVYPIKRGTYAKPIPHTHTHIHMIPHMNVEVEDTAACLARLTYLGRKE